MEHRVEVNVSRGASGVAAPAAVLLPTGAWPIDWRPGGMSVFTRAVYTLAQVADTIYLPKGFAFPAGAVDDLRAEMARRETRPNVVLTEAATGVLAPGGLFVLTEPLVFGGELCRALQSAAGGGAVASCRRAGEAPSGLWFAAPAVADALRVWLVDPNAPLPAGVPVVEVAPQAALCERVSDEASARRAEARLLENARKDSDTAVAKYFDRHVSGWITRRVLPTSLTPNQLTLMNTALALLAVVLLGVGTHGAQLTGAAILLLSIVLDGCDGEVARVKFMHSELGRRLDFFSDNVVNAGAIAAIGVGAYRRFGDPTYLVLSLLSGVAALACAWPVYAVFFRDRAPAEDGPPSALHRVLGALNGRDFVYLVLALAAADRTHWFVYPCFAGLMLFLPLALVLYLRHALSPVPRSATARPTR